MGKKTASEEDRARQLDIMKRLNIEPFSPEDFDVTENGDTETPPEDPVGEPQKAFSGKRPRGRSHAGGGIVAVPVRRDRRVMFTAAERDLVKVAFSLYRRSGGKAGTMGAFLVESMDVGMKKLPPKMREVYEAYKGFMEERP